MTQGGPTTWLRAGAAYFGWVFGVGFVLGSLRVPLLVPRLGERWAELLEMPLMALAIVLAARWVVRRFALVPHAGLRLAVGGLALLPEVRHIQRVFARPTTATFSGIKDLERLAVAIL